MRNAAVRSVYRRLMFIVLPVIANLAVVASVHAQATSRHCDKDTAQTRPPGPACLMVHLPLGKPAADAVYWTIDSYADAASARTASKHQTNSRVVEAFGKVWVFAVGAADNTPATEHRVARLGPMAVDRSIVYDAEFLQSTFSPGMSAPVHVHSGPEAFYAVSGDTCLETPDGVQTGKGPGNIVLVRAGPPMLLMATGNANRQGFALILHNTKAPPTTLVNDWTPKGLCKAGM
jgi:quercetin dioxygenase-like cupin family protein